MSAPPPRARVRGRGARAPRRCPSGATPGLRAPTSTSASRFSPTCRICRPPSPTCSAPTPSTSSTATSRPTRRSRNTTPRWAGIATTGTWARRSTISPPPTRCAPSGWAISAISPPTPSPTTTSCPASSCSPAARRPWGTPTGRPGSRPIWATPTPKSAKDVILLDHAPADAHLDRIIAPTIFSVRTNRRLFRGMVHLTETTSWQRASQVAREYSRWPLTDLDVERHWACPSIS